jgi:hypothetical protein
MQRFAKLFRALEVAAAVLLGISFFFLIIGVLGMRAAVAGLVVLILGAILSARLAPECEAGDEA